MTSDEFINFRRIVDSCSKHDDILSMMHVFNTWRRNSIIRGCLDMIVIEKMNGLRLIWSGYSSDMRVILPYFTY